MISGNSQQDQQSLAGTASNSKSIRSSHTISHNSHNNNNNNNSITITDPQAKYISVYPKDNSPIASTSSNCNNHNSNTGNSAQTNMLIGPKPPHLIRKSSEIVRGHQRRRLERMSSLDAAAESAIVAKLFRQSSDTSSTKPLAGSSSATKNAEKCDSFLHAQISKAGSSSSAATGQTGNLQLQAQRSNTTTSTNTGFATSAGLKTTRLQRHRSSETHDERLKQQQRGASGSGTATGGTAQGGGIFLSIHHENGHHHHHHRHHHTHRRGGSGGAAPIASSGSVVVLGSGVNTSDSFDVDDMELGLGGSANVVAHGSHLSQDGRMRALPSWILGEI